MSMGRDSCGSRFRFLVVIFRRGRFYRFAETFSGSSCFSTLSVTKPSL